MKRTTLGLMGLALLGLAIAPMTACKKNKDTATGTFMLHLHTNIDSSEAELGEVYRDADGRQIQLDSAQYFLSNICLIEPDGSRYPITGAYVLITADEEEYLVGKAPVGEYKSVTFDVGVDAAANRQDPGSFLSSSPLSKTGSDTWFGNTAKGFVFLNVAGKVDTTAGNNGPVNVPISYKIGSDALLQNVTLPDHGDRFVMAENQIMFIHLIADFGALLQNVNFKTERLTTTTVNFPLASKIAGNIPTIFSYEE